MNPELSLLFKDVVSRLSLPGQYFLSPAERLYWPYLLTSIGITLFLIFWKFLRSEHFDYRGYLKFVFSSRIWFHPSAITDYKYFIYNTILFAVFFGSFVLSTTVVAMFVYRNLVFFLGEESIVLPVSGWIVVLAYTIFFWFAEDFGRFLAHRWMHRNKYLWEFHKVHHSAEVLNPLTLYRIHPLEAILLNSFGGFFSGIVTGLVLFLVPYSVSTFTFLGVNAGIFLFHLYANLRHSHIAIHFPKWLSYILISPTQHQIHHSNRSELQNKNYGVAIGLWDLLTGSLFIPDDEDMENLVFGSGDETNNFRTLYQIYFSPFQNAFRLWKNADTWGSYMAISPIRKNSSVH